MCLTKTHRLPKISRKPIQVYKVFIKNLNSDELITIYQKQVCNVEETIKAKHSWLRGILKNTIEGEGVHACVNIYEAEYLLDINRFFIYNMCIYRCEIPPFTSYWIGNQNDIAASKMIIKEKVKL